MKVISHHAPIFLCLVILTILAGCNSLSSEPATTETPAQNQQSSSSSEYIEKHFFISGAEVTRHNIFVSEGETISGTWKSDDSIYIWYTDGNGRAKSLEDYGTGPNGERVIGVREPGIYKYPTLRVADSKGNFLYDDPMSSARGGSFSIMADIEGYYSLCFMSGSDSDSTNVDVRYTVR